MSTEEAAVEIEAEPGGMDLDADEPDEVEAASTRKRRSKTTNDPFKHPDGHNLIDGARWHHPKTGSPSECAVKGCERVLTRHLRGDLIDQIEAAEAAEAAEEHTSGAATPAEGDES